MHAPGGCRSVSPPQSACAVAGCSAFNQAPSEPPGGGSDVIARIFVPKLSDAIGQPIIIDNKSGANGNIGTEYVARSAPDGYTLGMGNLAALSVNVNRVALLRNTRPVGRPDVVRLATLALEAGADGITVHPRPDARHITTQDVQDLAQLLRRSNPSRNNSAAFRSVASVTACCVISEAMLHCVHSLSQKLSSTTSANSIKS